MWVLIVLVPGHCLHFTFSIFIILVIILNDIVIIIIMISFITCLHI